MPNDSAAALTAGTRTVGSDDLAQGLLLVQASAIKVVRLQLAMERRDRRAAIETVDELMRLDRRISDFLDDLPISSGPVSDARAEVQAQGRALAREKFALAAGMAGPRLSAQAPQWAESPEPAVESEAPAPRPLSSAGAPIGTSEAGIVAVRSRKAKRRSSRLIVALLTIALIVVGAVAFLLLTATGQALLAGLPAIEGAWR